MLCCFVRFQTIYHTLEDTVSAADAEEDLKLYRSTQGPGMAMHWPQFEVKEENKMSYFFNQSSALTCLNKRIEEF